MCNKGDDPPFTRGTLKVWTDNGPYFWYYIHLKWNVNLKNSRSLRFTVISSIHFLPLPLYSGEFQLSPEKNMAPALLFSFMFPRYRKSYHSKNSWYTGILQPLLFLIKKSLKKFIQILLGRYSAELAASSDTGMTQTDKRKK